MTIVNHNKYIRPLCFLLFILLFIPGCTEKEAPKKVSLYNRTNEGSKGMADSRQDILWFGFDLRLGAREDARIKM